MLRIKSERLIRGWNQTELAYFARMSSADVSRIELELENSLKEEEILLNEFYDLIQNVGNCLAFNEETDQVLITSLNLSETKS